MRDYFLISYTLFTLYKGEKRNILAKSKLGGLNKTCKYKKHLKRYYLRQKEPSQY